MTTTVPWVEKYRPQTMADIVGNTEALARLQIIAREGNVPHLLLCGPPGTGKTTSLLCLVRDLLRGAGETREGVSGAVLELNASDDRGLEVVREKIKLFAQTRKTWAPRGLHKMVLLDEADSMTPAAQQALRRTMELHSHTTRFALACNHSHKIIEPLQSRCAVVRFQRLTPAEMLQRLVHIIQQEAVAYTDDGLEALLYLAEGDLRQAVNALQATATGYGLVNAENVFKVCDQPHPVLIESILRACLVQRDIQAAHKEMQRLLHRGYAPGDVMTTFFNVAQSNAPFFSSEHQQLEVLQIISETTMRIAEGVGTPLQLAAMLAHLRAVVEEGTKGI